MGNKLSLPLILAGSLFSITMNAQDVTWSVATPDGQPDLQGVWGNNTITPVERPDRFGERQYLTDEEQSLLQRRIREITEGDGDALFGDGVF